MDARWTKKRGDTFYGYKQHVKVDKGNKVILSYVTTPANVHDSKGFEQLLDESDKDKDLYLDAGYAGQESTVKEHGMNPIICEKGRRNHPLTENRRLRTGASPRPVALSSTYSVLKSKVCTALLSGQ